MSEIEEEDEETSLLSCETVCEVSLEVAISVRLRHKIVEDQIRKFFSGRKKKVLQVVGQSGCGKSSVCHNTIDTLLHNDPKTVKVELSYSEMRNLSNLQLTHDFIVKKAKACSCDTLNYVYSSPFDDALELMLPASPERRYIVILYNMKEFRTLHSLMVNYFLKTRPDIFVTFITKKAASFTHVKTIQTPPLSHSDAIDFVTELLIIPESMEVSLLCKTLKHFPLALKLACNVIKRTSCSLADYQAMFEKRLSDIRRKGRFTLDGALKHCLVACCSIAVDTLREEAKDEKFAYKLFQILLSFGSDRVSENMLFNVALAVLGDSGAKLPYAASLQRLEAFGLIVWKGGIIKIFDCVMDIPNISVPKTRSGLKPITCLDTLKFALEVLDDMIPYARGKREDGDYYLAPGKQQVEIQITEGEDAFNSGKDESVERLESVTYDGERAVIDSVPSISCHRRLKSTRRKLLVSLNCLAVLLVCGIIPLWFLWGTSSSSLSNVKIGVKEATMVIPNYDNNGGKHVKASEDNFRQEKYTEPYIIHQGLGNISFPPVFEKMEWLEIQGAITFQNLVACFRKASSTVTKLVLNVDAMCGSKDSWRFSNATEGTFIFTRLSSIVIQNSKRCGIFPWGMSIRSSVLKDVTIVKSQLAGKSYDALRNLISSHANSLKDVVLAQSSIPSSFSAFAATYPELRVNYNNI